MRLKYIFVRKITLTAALSSFIALFGFAQAPGGKKSSGGAPPAIGRAFGKVTDSAGKPTRVGFRFEGEKKVRFAKTTGEAING